MTFFAKVEALRRRRGLSQRALAHALKVDPSAISRWKERGSNPHEATVAQLAELFGVTVEVLTDDDRELPASAGQATADHPALVAESRAVSPHSDRRLDQLEATAQKLITLATNLAQQVAALRAASDPPARGTASPELLQRVHALQREGLRHEEQGQRPAS
jgi:transcriptional regulator with XRE-family HTH domain